MTLSLSLQKLKDGHGAVDPVKSWLAFVKQSSVRRGQNYIENRKRSSRKGKKYLARVRVMITYKYFKMGETDICHGTRLRSPRD